MSALGGLRVVELGGGIAAAYATKLLADLGADVVVVEPPGGSGLRHDGPWPPGVDPAAVPRGGGLFQYLRSAARSVVADLDDAADRHRILGLVARADLVVESLGAGGLEARGMGPDALAAASPRVAVVRIAPFGQTGPRAGRPATSLVLQAAGGWAQRLGAIGGRPVHIGGRIDEYVAGAFASAAALTAWREARRTGVPVTVDVAGMECLVGTLPYPMVHREVFAPLGLRMPSRVSSVPGIVRCADGWVGLNALTAQNWDDICLLLEAPEFTGRMREVQLRGAEWDEFHARVEPWLDEHTLDEIVELFQAVRIPAAPIGNGQNLIENPQHVAREVYVSQPEGGFLRPFGAWRLGVTPVVPPLPAPALGEDRDVATRWAVPPPDAAGAPEPAQGVVDTQDRRRLVGAAAAPARWGGGRPGLPWSGLRVFDLTGFWAGPYLTMYLAAMGADVVKVESARRPDAFRYSASLPELGDAWWERSPVWQSTNLGKRDVTLDLNREDGVTLAHRLIAEADVVVENFTPRVMEQFGLDEEALFALNPQLVVLRMPGFGLSGPWRDHVGWALSFEQAAGNAYVSGDADGPPIPPGGFADPVGGMHAAVAIQAALEHRERTGQGQLIELAQLEAMVGMTAEQVIHWTLRGELQGRHGNRWPGCAPQGVYPCEGDDRWVAISVRDDADWAALVDALGRPAWSVDPDLATADRRHARHDELDDRLAVWTAGQANHAVEARLAAAGVPVAALLHVEEMYGEPQLVARGYFQAIEHPLTGVHRHPGWPMRFSFGPGTAHAGPAPMLGQHNGEVLGGLLGLSDDELDRLRAAGVIGERVPG
jgi:crotonobetainyl-CoA:carnitine CoA-transferase CaiB-like acyl-CoA transferase